MCGWTRQRYDSPFPVVYADSDEPTNGSARLSPESTTTAEVALESTNVSVLTLLPRRLLALLLLLGLTRPRLLALFLNRPLEHLAVAVEEGTDIRVVDAVEVDGTVTVSGFLLPRRLIGLGSALGLLRHCLTSPLEAGINGEWNQHGAIANAVGTRLPSVRVEQTGHDNVVDPASPALCRMREKTRPTKITF